MFDKEAEMTNAIMIRVMAADFDTWFAEHNGCQEARLEYGITDGPVYRDEAEPGAVLLQLNVESFDRAKGWFQDERFKAAVKRAGAVKRDIYMATPKAA
jgi:hypothetical protein